MPYKLLPEDELLGFTAAVHGDADERIEVYGYRISAWRKFLYNASSFLTLGLVALISKWQPVWKVRMTCRVCELSKAEILVLKDKHNRLTVSEVILQPIHESTSSSMACYKHSSCKATHQEAYLRFFVHQHIRYVWNAQEARFSRLSGLDKGVDCTDFFNKYTGYTKEIQEEKSRIYGRNSIDVEVKSYASLLIEEVLNPFYIFQIGSITLWILDIYYYYATCILVISVVSIGVSLYETKRQRELLKNIVSHANSGTVLVIRSEHEMEEIPSSCLVPGDLICVPPTGCIMSCDAVLTAGNCLVNESMLTGESVPDVKTPLLPYDEEFSPELHRKHVLFSGTQVIQTRYYGSSRVTAVVIRTGFSTAKGSLVRSILFPQTMCFKFYKDAIMFVFLLFAVASVGMVFTLYLYIKRHVSLRETIIRALDIVTIAVPPALPAAMTVATVYAQNRLKRANIFCISPHRINVGGKLKLVCFDKTGTLTEEGLDLWGILPVHNQFFMAPVGDPAQLPARSPLLVSMATCHTLTTVDGKLVGDPVDLSMFRATKWDIEEPGADSNRYDVLTPTVVKPPPARKARLALPHQTPFVFIPPQLLTETVDGRPAGTDITARPGDAEDVEIEEVPYEVGIVRQFPFTSSLQRMSVVCRTLGRRYMDLYAKGAPEMIHSLCNPATVPENYFDVLRGYTLQGFRVMALAYRPLEKKLTWHHVQRVGRNQVECNLTFLGFLIMQNMLKLESTPVIHTLHNACIRCVMVTGDNLLTAVSVARDCDMIASTVRVVIVKASIRPGSSTAALEFEEACRADEFSSSRSFRADKYIEMEENSNFQFAVDGHSFAIVRNHFPDIFEKLLVKGTVFARMLPDQKMQLVQHLQQLGYVVGMCGDGANDCGALKAADVGISLSEAESSVAAPFTSKVPNIQCVPTVIREGRCALATSFSMFKFISLYSLIQFLSVMLLYYVQTNFSDGMFLYVDLFVITTLAVTMSYAEPCAELVARRPQSSLVSQSNITSLLLQLVIVIVGQVGMLKYLQSQPWYTRPNHDPEEDVYNYWDTTTLFFISCYQYLIMAVVFSTGPPFQKPLWGNFWFLGNLVVLFCFTTFLLFQAFPSVKGFFDMVRWRSEEKIHFRMTILMVCGLSWILSHVVEVYVINSTVLKRAYRALVPKPAPKNRYKVVELEIIKDPGWLSPKTTVLKHFDDYPKS